MLIVMPEGLGPKSRTDTREAADARVASAAGRRTFIFSGLDTRILTARAWQE
jgi:hypothetical protein